MYSERLIISLNPVLNHISKSILSNLVTENEENTNIIYDYIIAEETDINIKNSTKEVRIMVLM